MSETRLRADRILIARLDGIAKRHARWGGLTKAEEALAAAELAEVAAGRTDLLAEVAGICEGASAGNYDEARGRQVSRLCRLAGADENAIPGWAAEGHLRRQHAGPPPFSRPQSR
jgi:hypothetical protein